jgi:hypothetical protein
MPHQIQHVTLSIITKAICDAVTFIGTDLGFMPSYVSARSLRAIDAMALLVSNVYTDIIKLLGCWRSDEMCRYLHLTTEPIMRDLSA